MVDTVNDFEGTRPDVPNVAAICVYPLFVETVKQALTAQEVKIASVAGGFPSSQTFTEVKIAETAMAVMQGADEIDVVMNLGYFMEDNFEELTEELQEIKESCRHAHLKVILETGALVTTENIQKHHHSQYSGADFIKTSTGKGYREPLSRPPIPCARPSKPTIPSPETRLASRSPEAYARRKTQFDIIRS